MRRIVSLAAILVVMMLSTVSCGGLGGGAANFNATTVEGEEFSLSEKRGEVVALYFMAGY